MEDAESLVLQALRDRASHGDEGALRALQYSNSPPASTSFSPRQDAGSAPLRTDSTPQPETASSPTSSSYGASSPSSAVSSSSFSRSSQSSKSATRSEVSGKSPPSPSSASSSRSSSSYDDREEEEDGGDEEDEEEEEGEEREGIRKPSLSRRRVSARGSAAEVSPPSTPSTASEQLLPYADRGDRRQRAGDLARRTSESVCDSSSFGSVDGSRASLKGKFKTPKAFRLSTFLASCKNGQHSGSHDALQYHFDDTEQHTQSQSQSQQTAQIQNWALQLAHVQEDKYACFLPGERKRYSVYFGAPLIKKRPTTGRRVRPRAPPCITVTGEEEKKEEKEKAADTMVVAELAQQHEAMEQQQEQKQEGPHPEKEEPQQDQAHAPQECAVDVPETSADVAAEDRVVGVVGAAPAPAPSPVPVPPSSPPPPEHAVHPDVHAIIEKLAESELALAPSGPRAHAPRAPVASPKRRKFLPVSTRLLRQLKKDQPEYVQSRKESLWRRQVTAPVPRFGNHLSPRPPQIIKFSSETPPPTPLDALLDRMYDKPLETTKKKMLKLRRKYMSDPAPAKKSALGDVVHQLYTQPVSDQQKLAEKLERKYCREDEVKEKVVVDDVVLSLYTQPNKNAAATAERLRNKYLSEEDSRRLCADELKDSVTRLYTKSTEHIKEGIDALWSGLESDWEAARIPTVKMTNAELAESAKLLTLSRELGYNRQMPTKG